MSIDLASDCKDKSVDECFKLQQNFDKNQIEIPININNIYHLSESKFYANSFRLSSFYCR